MNPHCGACQQEFPDDELREHINSCPAAKCLLAATTALMFGARDPSHKGAHLVFSIPKNAELIREYASFIANENSSFERARVHERLCSRLGLDYSTFKPFESDDIWDLPNQSEAEEIIYSALKREIWKLIGDAK